MKREREEEEKINVEGAKAFKKQEISFFSLTFSIFSLSLSRSPFSQFWNRDNRI